MWSNSTVTKCHPKLFQYLFFLYFWEGQFFPPFELLTPFFLPTVHYCIKTLRLWFLFLGPTIIFVPRAFLPPYFLSTDSAIRIFCFHLFFLVDWQFCHRFQYFTPIFFRQLTVHYIGSSRTFLGAKIEISHYREMISQSCILATIEQNYEFYRILTELGVLSHVQFFEISNYT